MGKERDIVSFSEQKDIVKVSLPDSYTTILPETIPKKDTFIPQNENWSVNKIDPLGKMIL